MEKNAKILILIAIIVVVIIVVIIIVVVSMKKKSNNSSTGPHKSTETFYHTNATDKFQEFIESYIKGEQGIF